MERWVTFPNGLRKGFPIGGRREERTRRGAEGLTDDVWDISLWLPDPGWKFTGCAAA